VDRIHEVNDVKSVIYHPVLVGFPFILIFFGQFSFIVYCCQKIQFWMPNMPGFSVPLKMWYFWQCTQTFLLSHCWEEASIEVGQPSVATNRKEWERERKMCRLVIVECGLRLRKTRDVYVTELSVSFQVEFIVLLYSFFYLYAVIFIWII